MRISTVLGKIASKEEIDRGKRSKTLNEVKLVENISKDLSFLEITQVQKEVLRHINCETMDMSIRVILD